MNVTLFAVWLGINDVRNRWYTSREITTIGLIPDATRDFPQIHALTSKILHTK